MNARGLCLIIMGIAGVVALGGCSSEPKAPPRDSILAQLRQEAENEKSPNDNQDTSIGVSTSWTIANVEVAEPQTPEAPTTGTITFRIRAETKDIGDVVQVDEFDKAFDYTFNTTLQKWIFDYKP